MPNYQIVNGNNTLNDSISRAGQSGDWQIFGYGGNDVIYGGAGANYLLGGAGNDLLYGNGYENILDGDSGNDTLNFTSGTYNIAYAGFGNDRINGYNALFYGVQQIPVYRGTADAQKSLSDAHRALTEDKVVLIYPDGTITKDPDGWPMNPRVGVARLALDHDDPVVPVARWGTREIYDHYEKKFRPFPRKRVTYEFGEPLDLSAYRGREVDNHVLREVSDLAMRWVRELLSDIRQEPAPEHFYSPAKAHRSDDAAQ